MLFSSSFHKVHCYLIKEMIMIIVVIYMLAMIMLIMVLTTLIMMIMVLTDGGGDVTRQHYLVNFDAGELER